MKWIRLVKDGEDTAKLALNRGVLLEEANWTNKDFKYYVTHCNSACDLVVDAGVPEWMVSAVKTYGIPLANLVKAYGIDKDIAKSFNGEGRWLVGDGSAYIITDFKSTSEMEIIIKTIATSQSGDWMGLFGADSGVNVNMTRLSRYNNQFRLALSTASNNYGTWSLNTEYELSIKGSTFKVKDSSDETIYANSTAVCATDYNLLLFAYSRNNTQTDSIYKGKINVASFKNTSNGSHVYCPIKLADGTCTMIDLMTMTYPTKVGTFTIE